MLSGASSWGSLLASRGSMGARLRGLLCLCMLVTAGLTAVAWLASVGTRLHRDWHLTTRNTALLRLLHGFPAEHNASFAQHSLNVQLSHQVALDRIIADSRPDECRNAAPDVKRLPRVSIIMPVYDESWSMLLRSLHSVVDKTPVQLLEEILIVDDHSSYPYLGKPLLDYCQTLTPLIRILRMEERQGLIRARMRAAREAKGEVLLFLDAHIECTEGWLPPLVAMVKEHPNFIAIPHIDSINPENIDYEPWNYVVNGGFTWGMEYVWKLAPQYITSRLRSAAQPYPTPTTIGCAMAVRRQFFFHLGGFDEGMYIWGGENLEISFRSWMCGGALFIVPCSRVGHLFRSVLPYVFPYAFGGGEVRQKNYQRVAEVWMDEYKELFYATTQMKLEFSPNDTKSLQVRKELRQKLQCKDFSWYLDNVIPEMPIPSKKAIFFGQLKSLASESCVSVQSDSLTMTMCGRQAEDQFFSLTMDYQITAYNDTRCLTMAPDNTSVVLRPCSMANLGQLWLFNTTVPAHTQALIPPSEVTKQVGLACMKPWALRRNATLLCLTLVGSSAKLVPTPHQLNLQSLTHYWFFTSKLNFDVHRHS